MLDTLATVVRKAHQAIHSGAARPVGRTRRRRAHLAAAICTAVLASCQSTSIVNQWVNPSPGPVFKRLLVVGFAKVDTNRRIFEDEMVRQLKAKGVDAVASYTLAPAMRELREDELKQLVTTSGADGMTTTRLVRVQTSTTIVPTSPLVYPGGFYGFYGGMWGGLYGGFYDPPAVIQNESYYLETRLFRAPGGELVWAATTSTFAPTSVTQAARDIAAVLIQGLANNHLIN